MVELAIYIVALVIMAWAACVATPVLLPILAFLANWAVGIALTFLNNGGIRHRLGFFYQCHPTAAWAATIAIVGRCSTIDPARDVKGREQARGEVFACVIDSQTREKR